MAQTTLGIDLGSYSVKAVLVESTLKRQTVKAFREIHLTDRSKPIPDAAELAVVARTLAEDPAFKATTVVLGLPGFATLKKWLEFPFNDRKKIDGTIGFPFSDLVPVSFQDYVIDYQVAGKTDAGQWRLLTVAAERETLRRILEAFRSAGLDPRYVVPGGLSWLNLTDQLSPEGSGVTAIVDVGYHATEVLVQDEGVPRSYRTVLAGTSRLADAVGKQLSKPLAEAQGIVESVAEVVAEGREAAGDLGQVQRTLREQADLLLGEIALSLRGYRIERGHSPGRVLLTGGLVRLAGIEERAELQLGLPVQRLDPKVLWSSGSAPVAVVPSIARALALALTTSSRGAGVEANLRKGEFEYRGAYEFLKGTLGALATFFVLFVLIAGVKTWFDHRVLQEQYDTMVADLGKITEKYLGQSVDDFDTALKMLQKGNITDLSEVIPEEDMYDLLVRLTDVLNRMNDKPAAELLPGMAVVPGGATAGDAAARKTGDKPEGAPEGEGASTELGAGGPGAEGEGGPLDEDPSTGLGAGGAGAEGKPAGEGAAAEGEGAEKVFVEIYDIQLDRKAVRLRAETNSVDAMEAFLTQLKKVSCLHHVLLENSDRISFKRHAGWRRFQVSATYECKTRDKDKDKAEKAGEPARPEGPAAPTEGQPGTPAGAPSPTPGDAASPFGGPSERGPEGPDGAVRPVPRPRTPSTMPPSEPPMPIMNPGLEPGSGVPGVEMAPNPAADDLPGGAP